MAKRGLATCDRLVRFFKRIGIGAAVTIGSVVWISGVGNLIRISGRSEADSYFLAFILTVCCTIVVLLLCWTWDD